MHAMKDALKRKMQSYKVAPDSRENDSEGLNAIDEKQIKEENDLAPDFPTDDGAEKQIMMDGDGEIAEEAGEQDLLRQILAALSDRGSSSGRGPMGLAERAAAGAKGKLAQLKKA